MKGAVQPLLGYGISSTPGLAWTARGIISVEIPGDSIGTLATAAGIILGIGSEATTYKSTDGGHTFSYLAATPSHPGGGNLATGNGVWLIGESTGSSLLMVSSDNGVVWSTVDTGVTTAQSMWIATDGNSNWIALSDLSGTNSYAVSTNNGTTWVKPGITDLSGAVSPPLWDGSKWVAVFFNSGQTDTFIGTSVDGHTWTLTGPTGLIVSVAYQAGIYVAGDGDGTVRTSSTAAGLATASEIIVPGLDSGGINASIGAAGKFFVFDDLGNVANSSNGFSWQLGTSNLPGGSSASGPLCYDPVNTSFAVVDLGNDVSTYP